MFGAVFLGAGIALSPGLDLLPVAINGFFAGVDAVIVGIRIISPGLTKEPILSRIGFVMACLGGVLAAPGFKLLKKNKTFRAIDALGVLATALLWAVTFYTSPWGHLASFAKWVPATMAK